MDRHTLQKAETTTMPLLPIFGRGVKTVTQRPTASMTITIFSIYTLHSCKTNMSITSFQTLLEKQQFLVLRSRAMNNMGAAFWNDLSDAILSNVRGTSSRCWLLHPNCLGNFFWVSNWVGYNGALLWRALQVTHNTLNSIPSCMAMNEVDETLDWYVYTTLYICHTFFTVSTINILWDIIRCEGRHVGLSWVSYHLSYKSLAQTRGAKFSPYPALIKGLTYFVLIRLDPCFSMNVSRRFGGKFNCYRQLGNIMLKKLYDKSNFVK